MLTQITLTNDPDAITLRNAQLASGSTGFEVLGLDGDDTINIRETSNDSVDGGDGDDRISTGPGNDTLVGGAGFDRLNGEGGNDSLDGGAGADWVTGSTGADTFVIRDHDDGAIRGIDNAERVIGLNFGEGDSLAFDAIGSLPATTVDSLEDLEVLATQLYDLRTGPGAESAYDVRYVYAAGQNSAANAELWMVLDNNLVRLEGAGVALDAADGARNLTIDLGDGKTIPRENEQVVIRDWLLDGTITGDTVRDWAAEGFIRADSVPVGGALTIGVEGSQLLARLGTASEQLARKAGSVFFDNDADSANGVVNYSFPGAAKFGGPDLVDLTSFGADVISGPSAGNGNNNVGALIGSGTALGVDTGGGVADPATGAPRPGLGGNDYNSRFLGDGEFLRFDLKGGRIADGATLGFGDFTAGGGDTGAADAVVRFFRDGTGVGTQSLDLDAARTGVQVEADGGASFDRIEIEVTQGNTVVGLTGLSLDLVIA